MADSPIRKAKSRTGTRRAAMLEAISWLEYRIEVCREAEERYSVENGFKPINSATERSARFELELAIKKIAEMAIMPVRSRAYKDAVAVRAEYLANRRASSSLPLVTGGNEG